jgi:hypothetical protein
VIRARIFLVALLLSGAACVLHARPAVAQAYVPASSLHPVILSEHYLDYPRLLLVAPRGYGLVASPASAEDERMAAYRDFEVTLGKRTRGVVGGSPSSEEGRRAKRRLLASIGNALDGVPGASIVRAGGRLWRQLEEKTDLDLDGYRVRLKVDEAVEGRLALKVQKRLR